MAGTGLLLSLSLSLSGSSGESRKWRETAIGERESNKFTALGLNFWKNKQENPHIFSQNCSFIFQHLNLAQVEEIYNTLLSLL